MGRSLIVGTLTEKLGEIAGWMKSRRMDALAVQETRWSGEGPLDLPCGYRAWLRPAESVRKTAGVGLILSAALAESVADAQRGSSRILVVGVQQGNQSMTFISAYASQISCPAETKRAFGDSLSLLLTSREPAKPLIVCGDFNARVHGPVVHWTGVCGSLGVGERNEEGDALLDFCAVHQLSIVNNIFPKPIDWLIT